MGKRDDDDTERPRAAGWYADPWSATGEGERYYDGKKWGSSARPLGRHTQTPPAPGASVTPISAAKRRTRGRFSLPRVKGASRPSLAGFRNKYGPLLILVALVAAVWGLPKLLHAVRGDNKNDVAVEQPTTPTTAPTRPPPSQEEATKPLGIPAAVPATPGSFETLLHQPNDETVPVAFDPCRPIHYVVNPAGAPPDGAAILASAIARVQTATGLHFVDDGATTEEPDKQRDAYLPNRYAATRWAPVLIAWSDDVAFPPLAGSVAGIGEAAPVYTNDSKNLVIVSGQVVFDRNELSMAKAPDRREVKAVMLHELGHLVGLDHTGDKRQLMFSEVQFNVADYAPGDRQGLAELGTQPCYPDL